MKYSTACPLIVRHAILPVDYEKVVLHFNVNQELNPLRGSSCIRLFFRGLHPRLLIVLSAIWRIKCLKDINFNNPVRSSVYSI